MYKTIFLTLQPSLDPNAKITILRSSEDPELFEYFEKFGALGSTDMNSEDGSICIKFHDKDGVAKLTWLEEFIHALQYLEYGNIGLSYVDQERKTREVEAASCILNNAKRLRLSQGDLDECEQNLEFYGAR